MANRCSQGLSEIQGDRRHKVNVISGIVRISKPGKRLYVNKDKLPKVKSGMGIAIKYIQRRMTDKQARSQRRRRRSHLLRMVGRNSDV